MTTTTTHEDSRRTYGHWRRPRSPGVWGLGAIGTAALLASLILAVLVQQAAGLLPALVVVAAAAALLIPLRLGGGNNVYVRSARRLAYRRARRRGTTTYLPAGIDLGEAGTPAFSSGSSLPGLLAGSQLIPGRDVHGSPFAAVVHPRGPHYAVVLRCDPQGGMLVDADTVDQWVSDWGGFLRAASHDPQIVGVSVTAQTMPDTGSALSSEIDNLLTADAPPLAAQVLAETRSDWPTGSAEVATWVTVTYSARRPGQRTMKEPEMAALIGDRLPGLLSSLSAAGAGDVRAMTADDLAVLARSAYDPDAAAALADLRAARGEAGLPWSQAGPSGQREEWGALIHGGHVSVSWQMAAAPPSLVTSSVLNPLLRPHPMVPIKRVTVLYRPYPPDVAVAITDSDVRTARGHALSREQEVRATDSADLAAARGTAAEIAAGHSLTRFAVLVTATVAGPEQLAAARTAIEQSSASSRILLRRCHGAQSAAFAAGLGLGMHLASWVSTPDFVREKL